MKVKVNTTYYEFAHGHRPRGDGRWAFFFRHDAANVGEPFFVYGTFDEAKAVARKKAKRARAAELVVGS